MDEKVKEVFKLGWRQVKSDEAVLRILSGYMAEVTGSTPCCLGTIEQFFYKTKIIINQKKSKMESKKSSYELKKTAVIFLRSKNIHVTNANLTDELARAILKERPSKVSEFTDIPQDGEPGGGGGEDLSLKSNAQLKKILEDSGKVSEAELKKLTTKAKLLAKIDELGLK